MTPCFVAFGTETKKKKKKAGKLKGEENTFFQMCLGIEIKKRNTSYTFIWFAINRERNVLFDL